ncbi:hypothetical protein JCM5296_002349 [Sporobolomyces johnsonii]
MYVPLLCYIQGNLKVYCCHKVDKRFPSQERKRLANLEAEIARKEARGDFSHLKDKTGKFIAAPLPQPTPPKVGLADNDLYSDAGSIRGGGSGAYQYPSTVPYAQHYAAPSVLGGRKAYPYASHRVTFWSSSLSCSLAREDAAELTQHAYIRYPLSIDHDFLYFFSCSERS